MADLPSSPVVSPAPAAYSGWLTDASFLKRCLAIYGYSIVGGLIVGLGIAIIMLVLGLAFGLALMPFMAD